MNCCMRMNMELGPVWSSRSSHQNPRTCRSTLGSLGARVLTGVLAAELIPFGPQQSVRSRSSAAYVSVRRFQESAIGYRGTSGVNLAQPDADTPWVGAVSSRFLQLRNKASI